VADRALRVAVVGRSVYSLHGFGGLERHLYDLVRYHLGDGWNVTLITRTPSRREGVDPARWSEIANHPRCTIRYVPYRTFPLAGRRGTTILDRSTAYPYFGARAGRVAARLVQAGDIDIVYGVGASVYGYARARGRDRGASAPLVFNPQGLEEFGGIDGRYGGHPLKALGYMPLRRVVRAVAADADAVIATDAAIQPVVLAHLPVPRSRVRLIPNGLDVVHGDRFVSREAGLTQRATHHIGADDLLLLSVGRLEANKGFIDLVEALSQLQHTAPWRWVLVGEGPMRSALEARLAERALRSRVILAGRVHDDELHAWYNAANLFVHPTRYEGSSLVTLEALLHAKPVVATRVGGLPDKVIPGRTGWLTPSSDPSALASALADAFDHRRDWVDMGRAGRALLEERFDWRVVQNTFHALYDELLQR
jgi:glycosyltransferase involved in cell wall biosynthesis